MNNINDRLSYSEKFSTLYPSAIIEACGGVKKFSELKTVDCDHLTGLHGSVYRKAVTEPIMIGVNRIQEAFIILTFDVYNLQRLKIAKKISEVFYHDHCVYEWDHGVETWQGTYQMHGYIHAGCGMPVLKIAKRIQMLLSGHSLIEPCRFNNGEASSIKLWNKD